MSLGETIDEFSLLLFSLYYDNFYLLGASGVSEGWEPRTGRFCM